MLEKAYNKIAQTRTAWLQQHGVPISQEFVDFANAIGELRDLIPTDHAAALEEVKRQARLEEAEVWHAHHGKFMEHGPECPWCCRIATLRAEGAKQP